MQEWDKSETFDHRSSQPPTFNRLDVGGQLSQLRWFITNAHTHAHMRTHHTHTCMHTHTYVNLPLCTIGAFYIHHYHTRGAVYKRSQLSVLEIGGIEAIAQCIFNSVLQRMSSLLLISSCSSTLFIPINVLWRFSSLFIIGAGTCHSFDLWAAILFGVSCHFCV